MPPAVKYRKEDIINAAYEIVKNEGIKGVNARRIAKELNCSVQPIFHNFSSMEELNKAVYEKIYSKYIEYMNSGRDKEKPYKNVGMSYIRFAKDYPEFFKLIFMQKTNFNAEEFLLSDSLGDDIIKIGQELTGLDYEQQKQFHIKVWIFTHGLACLQASKTIMFSEEELDTMLTDFVLQLLYGYKKRGNLDEKCN